MPGPAVTVEILGDTSSLDTALSDSKTGFDTFKSGLGTLLTKIGGVSGAVGLAVEGFNKLVELGGPEAQAHVDELAATFNDQMAPVLAELTPLIADLVGGLTELMAAVLPVLVPLLQGLVSVLGFLFIAVGTVFDVLDKLWKNVLQPLIDVVLNNLWDKLDAVRGMFDLVKGAVDTLVTILRDTLGAAIDGVLGPLQGLLDLVGGIIDAIADAIAGSETLAEHQAANPGYSPRGAPAPAGTVTINTGSDPQSVMRAYRRYVIGNGGARAAAPRGALVRGW